MSKSDTPLWAFWPLYHTTIHEISRWSAIYIVDNKYAVLISYNYIVTVNASGRMSSVRGELLVPTVRTNGATPSEGGNSPPPQPKTFLRRLGIRKPSLMSLTSPLQTGRTARTFSLDDLLRPQVPSKVSTIHPLPNPSPIRTALHFTIF